MKIYEFRNSKGELGLVVGMEGVDGVKEIENFFGKDLDTINKELEEKEYITRYDDKYTMSTMFLDFIEEEDVLSE